MFGLDDIVEGTVGALIWGVGLVTGGAAASVAVPKARPIAKRALIGYFALTEHVRERAAQAVEHVEDLYAEARHEYESDLIEDESESVLPARASRSRRGEQSA